MKMAKYVYEFHLLPLSDISTIWSRPILYKLWDVLKKNTLSGCGY